MQNYEKLGVFYLGRPHDLSGRTTAAEPLLYESRHLVTHGLVVGMTGSGKTGLCFDLIEEAALDGIPALLLDPKGDLGNLLLTFPELRPADFAPWINPDDAQRQGMSVEAYAAQQAERWRQGLARWDQDGDRIRRLRAAAEFTIYTPGSNSGRPLSILSASFAVPPIEVREEGELLQERIAATVTALLGLLGIPADSRKSREALLLSQLVQRAWNENRPLDLASLIQDVQHPPMARVGVMDLEAFFPARERFELAMQLNHLLASPAFSAWLEGDPLDVGRLLYTADGRPRVAICSLAHLGDPERMSFVSLLLHQVSGWMRGQSGTNSLRLLVYMDEIAGYFPPVANPPSKPPLLTLLKQGRAFGVGVLLATQNPVDLDYKGLANIGTWFIGRLQTERDKARVLEGLEGAAVGQGERFDRAAAAEIIAGLGNRIFLLHNVHQPGLTVFESRWAMSYLRGPLSRAQIRSLTGQGRGGAQAETPGGAPPPKATVAQESAPPAGKRPLLPPEVPQCFAPVRPGTASAGRIIYQPRLLGAAQLRFTDARLGVDTGREIVVTTEIVDRAVPVDWTDSEHISLELNDLSYESAAADYAPCPTAAARPKNYPAWAKAFRHWLSDHGTLGLWRSPTLGETSMPDEDERQFRIRLREIARERRDVMVEKLRQAYAPKLAALQERLRRAEAAREREASQATRARFNTVVSFGTTLVGAFLGRRPLSAGTVGRAATTMRRAGRALDQTGDVARAQENVGTIASQMRELESRFEAELSAVQAQADPAMDPLERVEVRPARGQVQVRLVTLVWLPYEAGLTGLARPVF
ncbi:MAG: ATP-binding protein [Verrucomicrobiales bacterium]|nr:ATP-binding protein [Verrucomicrobiales bacterium]